MRPHKIAALQEAEDLLIGGFPVFVAAFSRNPAFTKTAQLATHAKTIAIRRELGSAQPALNDFGFLNALYDTLRAWGIGSRGSVFSTSASSRKASLGINRKLPPWKERHWTARPSMSPTLIARVSGASSNRYAWFRQQSSAGSFNEGVAPSASRPRREDGFPTYSAFFWLARAGVSNSIKLAALTTLRFVSPCRQGRQSQAVCGHGLETTL